MAFQRLKVVVDRRVTQTGKDSNGDIMKLCNPGEKWSPRYKISVISDIDGGGHTYYVDEAGHRSDIHVYTDGNGVEQLRTSADPTSKTTSTTSPTADVDRGCASHYSARLR